MMTKLRPIQTAYMAALAMIMSATIVCAQTYTYTQRIGPQPYTGAMTESSVRLMKGPVNESLSQWQELPFEFSFFGENVSGYKACDNGYICFESTHSRPSSDNSSMGTSASPNNAIFGFWDQLELLGAAPEYRQEIRSATIGVAPNRVHVVMWMGVTARISGGGDLFFAIALKEQGGFAIVQSQRSGTGQYRGAIGAENNTGTASVFVDGSPSLVFPDMWTSDDDDITYEFVSTGNTLDLAVSHINAPDLVLSGTNYPVGVVVRNDGGFNITEAVIHLTTGRAILATLTLDKPLAPNESVVLTAPREFMAGREGEYVSLAANLVSVNGANRDDNASNDVDSHVVYFNRGASVDRRPLFEEFTGAWCGNCYDGHLKTEAMHQEVPEAIVVAVHAGGTDAMIIPEGQQLAAAFRPAFPMAMIDRHLFAGDARVPFGRGGGAWATRAKERQQETAVAKITIDPIVLWATNALGINVSVDFVDDVAPADYRLNVYVVENEVTGSGSGYDQRDYGDAGPWHSPYTHKNVLRHMTTGLWGDSTLLPDRPLVGESFDVYYRQDIDFTYDFLNTTIVAFITRHHATDPNQRVVLNAEAFRLDGSVSVEEELVGGSIVIAPNPANSRANFTVPSGESFVVYTAVGVPILRGTGTGKPLAIDCTSWAAGMYFVRALTSSVNFVVSN